jgi:hypothetical protein
MQNPFILGLSLGQPHEPTALAIVERIGEDAPEFFVRHLERFDAFTPYKDVVERVAGLVSRAPLLMRRDEYREGKYGTTLRSTVEKRPRVAVDATGVGKPVAKLFGYDALGCDVERYVLTAGDAEARGDGVKRIPKRDLAGLIQTRLQAGRLKVASGLEHSDTLVREMRNFRVKVSLAGTDALEAYREGKHDDLVLAVGVALATARHMGPGISLAAAMMLAHPREYR